MLLKLNKIFIKYNNIELKLKLYFYRYYLQLH